MTLGKEAFLKDKEGRQTVKYNVGKCHKVKRF